MAISIRTRKPDFQKLTRKLDRMIRTNRFKKFFLYKFYKMIVNLWDSFWWDYQDVGPIVFGRECNMRRTFKKGNLAIFISLISLILVLIFIIKT